LLAQFSWNAKNQYITSYIPDGRIFPKRIQPTTLSNTSAFNDSEEFENNYSYLRRLFAFPSTGTRAQVTVQPFTLNISGVSGATFESVVMLVASDAFAFQVQQVQPTAEAPLPVYVTENPAYTLKSDIYSGANVISFPQVVFSGNINIGVRYNVVLVVKQTSCTTSCLTYPVVTFNCPQYRLTVEQQLGYISAPPPKLSDCASCQGKDLEFIIPE
jgi:hypothetical protein